MTIFQNMKRKNIVIFIHGGSINLIPTREGNRLTRLWILFQIATHQRAIRQSKGPVNIIALIAGNLNNVGRRKTLLREKTASAFPTNAAPEFSGLADEVEVITNHF